MMISYVDKMIDLNFENLHYGKIWSSFNITYVIENFTAYLIIIKYLTLNPKLVISGFNNRKQCRYVIQNPKTYTLYVLTRLIPKI